MTFKSHIQLKIGQCKPFGSKYTFQYYKKMILNLTNLNDKMTSINSLT